MDFSLHRMEHILPDYFSEEEKQLIGSYQSRVLPVLTGKREPANREQEMFLMVMRGEFLAETAFELAWRKAWALHHLLEQLDDAGDRGNRLNLEVDRLRLRLRQQSEQVSLVRAHAARIFVLALPSLRNVTQPEAAEILVEQLSICPECVEQCALPELMQLDVANIERLEPSLRIQLFNQLLALGAPQEWLQTVKSSVESSFAKPGPDLSNFMVIHSTTDGQ